VAKKPDPGGAANRMEQQVPGENAGDAAGQRRDRQQERSAEGQVDVTRIVKARNDFRMENAEGEPGGTARMNPTRDRKRPRSKSAEAVRIGERVRMNAPNVQ